MDNEKLLKLRRFNLIMGGLHLVQGIAMLILASTVIQKLSEFKPDIIINFLSYNTVTSSLEPASSVLFSLPFGVMVALFLLLSAFFPWFNFNS